jgi:hypothetical protein
MAKRRKPSKASLFPDRFSSEIIRWKDGDTTRIKTNFDQVAARKKFKVVVQSLSGNVEGVGDPPADVPRCNSVPGIVIGRGLGRRSAILARVRHTFRDEPASGHRVSPRCDEFVPFSHE